MRRGLKLHFGGLEDGANPQQQQPQYPNSAAAAAAVVVVVVIVVVQLETAPPGERPSPGNGRNNPTSSPQAPELT